MLDRLPLPTLRGFNAATSHQDRHRLGQALDSPDPRGGACFSTLKPNQHETELQKATNRIKTCTWPVIMGQGGG